MYIYIYIHIHCIKLLACLFEPDLELRLEPLRGGAADHQGDVLGAVAR